MRHHMLHSSETPQYCDHRPVIEEINEAHDLAIQLRALLLPSLQVGSSGAELVRGILDELVKRFASSLFMLHSQSRPSEEKENDSTCCHKKRKICCEGSRRRDTQTDGHKREKKMQNAWSKTSTIPFEDGYLWRKYGQKNIREAKYPRSYYRCIYSEDQGCRATKTVQQENMDEDPPKFTVVYKIQHTCQSMGSKNINIACVMDSGSASFQTSPPSCGSSTIVDDSNNNPSNTISGFSSNDGEIARQLLSEPLLGQEMSPGSVERDVEIVVHSPWLLADCGWLDVQEQGPFDDSTTLW